MSPTDPAPPPSSGTLADIDEINADRIATSLERIAASCEAAVQLRKADTVTSAALVNELRSLVAQLQGDADHG